VARMPPVMYDEPSDSPCSSLSPSNVQPIVPSLLKLNIELCTWRAGESGGRWGACQRTRGGEGTAEMVMMSWRGAHAWVRGGGGRRGTASEGTKAQKRDGEGDGGAHLRGLAEACPARTEWLEDVREHRRPLVLGPLEHGSSNLIGCVLVTRPHGLLHGVGREADLGEVLGGDFATEFTAAVGVDVVHKGDLLAGERHRRGAARALFCA
jgi:hypothetical protein